MKRRNLLTILALVALLVGSFLWLSKRQHARESYLGRHTRDWAWALLGAPDDTNRQAAESALRALGADAVPALRRMLHERDAIYEKPIVEATRVLPIQQRHAIIRQLRPGSAFATRLSAINALGVLGPVAAPAIPDLAPGLLDVSGQIRWDTARALVAIGDVAIPVLLTGAESTNVVVRQAVVYSLIEANTNLPMVTLAIFDALLDSDPNVQATAAHVIGQLGWNAAPKLKEGLEASDPAIQLAAMRATTWVRPPTRLVLTNLMTLATNSAGELRRTSVETLGKLRITQSDAVEVIVSALDDPDPGTRVTAIKAVGEVSWKAVAALPRLTSFTRSPDAAEREAAARSLGQFSDRATNAVPALQALLADPEANVRAAATNALQQIQATPAPLSGGR